MATGAAHHPLDAVTEEAPVASEAQLRRFQMASGVLGFMGLILVVLAFWCQQLTHGQVQLQVQQVRLTQSLLHKELAALNDSAMVSPPEPLALKQLLQLGQTVTESGNTTLWLGSLYQQRLQNQLTQAIEALARPVSGLDSTVDNRLQRERAIRLESLPRLQALEDHLQTAQNGWVPLLLILAGLTGLPGLVCGIQYYTLKRRNALHRRINTLSLALRTQQASDQTRLGATLALEGVMAAIENTRNQDHKQALMQIGAQLEELKHSGQKAVEFAHAFHKLSSQATQLAQAALTHHHRNTRADESIEAVKTQLDGLREDLRTAASGLRKAGEVSRRMLANPQMDQAESTVALVEQSQLALKDAIEGLVMASQKINAGHLESGKLAEHLAVNQVAWSNLLERIEQYAEESAKQSEQALQVARHLIQASKTPPNKSLQAAKAPPQLLP